MKPTNYSDGRALTHRIAYVQTNDANSATFSQRYHTSIRRIDSTYERPNTHFYSARDNSLNFLDQELEKISNYAKISSNCLDKNCGSWSRRLRNAMGKKAIPSAKIIEYIPTLIQFVKTFPQWEARHLIDTYKHLVDVDFFSQSRNLHPEIRNQVAQLNSQLLNEINYKIFHANSEYISLFSCIYLYCGMTKAVKYDNQNKALINDTIKFLVRKFESNITEFSVIDYRTIINHTFILIENTGNAYKKTVQDLIEVFLYQMTVIDKQKKDNSDFFSFFNTMSDFIFEGFPVSENIEKALYCLFKRIDLNTDIKTAVLGINTIINLVFKEKVFLNRDIEEKIYHACEFIEKNFRNSMLLDSLMIASFISKLVQVKDKTCPKRLTRLLILSLNQLISHMPNLSTRQLMKLLVIIKELIVAEVHIYEMVNPFLDTILKMDNQLLSLSKFELHCQIGHLSRILKSLTAQGRDICKKPQLRDFINRLVEKLSENILDSALPIRSNSFIALSELASIGFVVDKSKQAFIKKMYSTLINEAENFSTEQAIDLIHSCCIFGNLFDLEIEKHSALFKRIFPAVLHPKYKLKKKLTYMWSMIVFSAINEEKLNQQPNAQLNREIFEVFSTINRKNLSEPYAHQILSITENWFGKKSTFVKERQEKVHRSHSQTLIVQRLREHFDPAIQMIEEYSDNDLAPCDIVFPDKKIIVEVQGILHYLDDDRKCKNGSTLLKNNLYRKKGYHIIEVQVYEDGFRDSDIDLCIKEIELALKLPKLSF